MSKFTISKTIYGTTTLQDAAVASTAAISQNISTDVENRLLALIDPATDDLNIVNLQIGKAGLSSDNTFSGSNTFSNIPKLSTAKTIADYNDDAQLVDKKYCDDKVTNLLNSDNTFNGTQILNKVNIGGWAYIENTATGSQTNTNISGNTTFVGNLTRDNSFQALNQSFTFKTTPKFDSNLTPDYTDSNSMPTLAYLKKNKFVFSETTRVISTDTTYELRAPVFESVTENPTGDFPKVNINVKFTNTTGLIGPNVCMMQINCFYMQANPVSTDNGPYTSIRNTLVRDKPAAQFVNTDINLLTNLIKQSKPASSPITILNGLYIIGLAKDSQARRRVYVKPYSQNINVVTTDGNTNANVTYGQTTIAYNNANYQFSPFKLSYVDDNTFRISFCGPQCLNDPARWGWINSVGFSAEILTGGSNITGYLGTHCGAEFDPTSLTATL